MLKDDGVVIIYGKSVGGWARMVMALGVRAGNQGFPIPEPVELCHKKIFFLVKY